MTRWLWVVFMAGCAAQDQTARLRERARVDPVGVLLELGVREDDLEKIAKEMYYRWLARSGKSLPATRTAAATAVPQAPAPAQAGRTVAVNHTFFCFQANRDIDVKICGSDIERCERWRSGWQNPQGPCFETTSATCFIETDTATGKRDSACFSSVDFCNTMAAQTRKPSNHVSDCVTMRYQR